MAETGPEAVVTMKWLFPVAICTLYTVAYVYESQTARIFGSLLTVGFISHKWWVKGLPRY